MEPHGPLLNQERRFCIQIRGGLDKYHRLDAKDIPSVFVIVLGEGCSIPGASNPAKIWLAPEKGTHLTSVSIFAETSHSEGVYKAITSIVSSI